MRYLPIFLSGIICGCLGMYYVNNIHGSENLTLSHIAIVVTDYDKAKSFYVDELGLKEAYTVYNDDDSVLLSYLHFNRNSFLELIPQQPGMAPGLAHFALEIDDLDALMLRLKIQQLDVEAPHLTPANAWSTSIFDPASNKIELMSFTAESLQSQAMDRW